MQKLTLAKMNLSSTVHHVIELVGCKDHLQYLNLTQTKLRPSDLARMSEAILQIILSIRDVDMSYNYLNFQFPGTKDFVHSEKFVENIVALLHTSRLLNHINLSGMEFSHEAVLEVSRAAIRSRLLMSVHLSDNGITTDPERLKQTLNVYGLTEADVPIQRQGDRPNVETLQTIKRHNVAQSVRDSTYHTRIQDYFKVNTAVINNEATSDELIKHRKRMVLKEKIIVANELREIDTDKLVNRAKLCQEIGRTNYSQLD